MAAVFLHPFEHDFLAPAYHHAPCGPSHCGACRGMAHRGPGACGAGPFATSRLGAPEPSLRILQREGGVLLRAELPGATQRDVSIEIEDRTLHLLVQSPVQRQYFRDAWTGRVFVREHRPATPLLERRLRLGSNIDTGAISAELEDSVLTVRLPYRRRTTVPVVVPTPRLVTFPWLLVPAALAATPGRAPQPEPAVPVATPATATAATSTPAPPATAQAGPSNPPARRCAGGPCLPQRPQRACRRPSAAAAAPVKAQVVTVPVMGAEEEEKQAAQEQQPAAEAPPSPEAPAVTAPANEQQTTAAGAEEAGVGDNKGKAPASGEQLAAFRAEAAAKAKAKARAQGGSAHPSDEEWDGSIEDCDFYAEE